VLIVTAKTGFTKKTAELYVAGIALDVFQILYYSIAVLQQWEQAVAMSVRLDPTLETRVEQESRRLGVTKSEFVKDALERVLGLKNPADLLDAVRSGKPMGNPQASRNVSARMRAKLRAKLSD